MLHAFCKAWFAKAWLPVMLTAAGCASATPNPAAHLSSDITGRWEGTSRGMCRSRMPRDTCNAVQVIGFTLFQEGGDLTGTFSGQDEHHFDCNGHIGAARIRGINVAMRVMMPDGSSCIFHAPFDGMQARGSYMCYQGGGLVDEGQWRVRRVF